MALIEVDRKLLERCLRHEPGAWNDFVDRFLGLLFHVVKHTAHCRSVPLTDEDVEDVCSEILLRIVHDDYSLLRRFRGKASLATYLAVVARRVCVRELVKRNFAAELGHTTSRVTTARQSHQTEPIERIESEEEIAALLHGLNNKEAAIIRMYHLDGKSYSEIGQELDIAENSIGPTLHRARTKIRRNATGQSSVK